MIVNTLVFLFILSMAVAATVTSYVQNMQAASALVNYLGGQDRASQMTFLLNQDLQLKGGINMLLAQVPGMSTSLHTASQYETTLIPLLNSVVQDRSIRISKIRFFKFTNAAGVRILTEQGGEFRSTDYDVAIAEGQTLSGEQTLSFQIVLPR